FDVFFASRTGAPGGNAAYCRRSAATAAACAVSAVPARSTPTLVRYPPRPRWLMKKGHASVANRRWQRAGGRASGLRVDDRAPVAGRPAPPAAGAVTWALAG